MAVKQYEATATCAFPLKDGRMMSISAGNVYDVDFTQVAKHHQELFKSTEQPVAKKPSRKPASKPE